MSTADDHLAAPWPFDDDAPPDDAEPAEIDGLPQANRWLRRLALIDRDIAEVVEVATAEIHATTVWRDKRLEVLGRARAWVADSLDRWGRAHGRSTVQLPGGSVALRKNPDRLIAPTVVDVKHAESLVKAGVEVETVPAQWKIPLVKAKAVLAVGPVVEELPADVEVPEGYKAHAALTVDGEVVAGFVYLVPEEKRVEIKTASLEIEEDLFERLPDVPDDEPPAVEPDPFS